MPMRRISKQLNAKLIQNSDTTNFDKFKDITLPAGVEVDVGEYEVPANVIKATWGGGNMFGVLFDDTTTQAREEGTFRFYVQGGSGTRVMVFEAKSEIVGASGQISTPSEWNHMPEGGFYAAGGGKLIVTFEADLTDTTDSSDHTIPALPIVEYS